MKIEILKTPKYNRFHVIKTYPEVKPSIETIKEFLETVDSDDVLYLRPKMDIFKPASKIISTTDSTGTYNVAPHEEYYPAVEVVTEAELIFDYKNFHFIIWIDDKNEIHVNYCSVFTGNKRWMTSYDAFEVIKFLREKTPAEKPVKKVKVVKKNDKEITRIKSLITRRTNDIVKMKNEVEKLKKMIEENEKSLPELNKTLEDLVNNND